MAVNALFVTTILLMALGLFLLQECQFLVPYRALLFGRYGGVIGLYAAALFVNVFAAVYLVSRKVFLKDTGRKLAHLEKQLRSGGAISEELAERLRE
jgi:hypothetical protein